MNIVIVDNDPSLLRSLEIHLVREGHCVTGFTDPRGALFHFVRNHPVDVLLLDYSMPEMNGDELIETLKPELPADCRIVMMSAHGDLSRLVDAKRLGIEAPLYKPLSLKRLKLALNKTTPNQEGVTP